MTPSAAPEKYKQAGLFMTISGALSVLTGAMAILSGLMVCVSTYGLCCFCPALGVIPIVTGALELVAANQMREGIYVPSARAVGLTQLVVSVLTLSMISIVLEALALANLSDPEVRAFLDAHESSAVLARSPAL